MTEGGLDVVSVAAAARTALSAYQLRPPGWSPQPHQIPPPGDWYGWLLNAGRGAGKTRTCAQYIIDHVKGPPCLPGPTPHWIGIIAPTLGDAATACFSGPSGIGTHDPTAKMTGGVGGIGIKWPNGSYAKLFGASTPEDVERLRAGGNTCTIANTLVRTALGEVRIADVRVGDHVWTRTGLRRVLRAAKTRENAKIWRLTTESGRVLEGTADHEIWTQRGWVQLQFLSPNDTLTTWQHDSSSMTASDGTSANQDTLRTRGEDSYIATSGNSITDLFPRSTSFITSTMTSPITTSRTLRRSRRPSTFESIPVEMLSNPTDVPVARRGKIVRVPLKSVRSAQEHSSRAPWGVNTDASARQSVEVSTILRLVKHSTGGHTRGDCALCAVLSSARQSSEVMIAQPVHGHAQLDMLPRHESYDTANDESLRTESVRSVEPHFTLTATDPPKLAQDRVVSVSETNDAQDVYDLLVEHDHEFFANDILVANCLIWAEELAAWRYLQECYEQMRFGLRSGPRPHWVASTTPKPKPLIKKLVKNTPRNVVVTHATTHDNPHLEQHIRDALFEEYSDRDIGRQELYAAIMEQDANALWRREHLDEFRLKPSEVPDLARLTVGVDPSGGAGEQGIIVGGKYVVDEIINGRSQKRFEGFVLDDRTCILPPAGWGRRAVQAAVDWEADDIVVETNFGGEMAVVTIRDAALAMGIPIPVKTVVASRGKRVRAEPVSALSVRGQWHHVGHFEQLEDQLCTWTPEEKYSPDRLDAMVWTAWHNKIVATRPRGMGSMASGGMMARAIG